MQSKMYRRSNYTKAPKGNIISLNGILSHCTDIAFMQRSNYGYNTFIGCSGWRNGDSNDAHRYLSIEKGLDEALVAQMLKNSGKLPNMPRGQRTNPEEPCCLVLHPRSHKKVCRKHCNVSASTINILTRSILAFTHIINGNVKQGKIRPHDPCNSRLVIFEPVDQSIRKAIVIPSHSHNHPRHPHAKPTQKEKDFVKAASKASGKTQISAKKLRTSATTASMLDSGESWESQLPAMVDDQRLRKFIKTINRETYPRGLGWEGQFDIFAGQSGTH